MCITDHTFIEHHKSKHVNHLRANTNMSSIFSIIPFL